MKTTYNYCKIWTFKGFNTKFIVTSVNGPLYTRDFGKDIKKDQDLNPAELFDADTEMVKVSSGICEHIRSVSQGCDFLCFWMDLDANNSNICFDILKNCRHNLPRPTLEHTFKASFS